MGQTSHVVPIHPLALVQCFAMVATVRVVETQVEVFSKEWDLVAPDSPKSSSSLKFPCLQYSRMEWFRDPT